MNTQILVSHFITLFPILYKVPFGLFLKMIVLWMKKYTISFACISVCVYLLTVMDQRKCTKKLCKKQQSLSCLKHPCVDRNYIIFLILLILFSLSTLLNGFFLTIYWFYSKIYHSKNSYYIFFLAIWHLSNRKDWISSEEWNLESSSSSNLKGLNVSNFVK